MAPMDATMEQQSTGELVEFVNHLYRQGTQDVGLFDAAEGGEGAGNGGSPAATVQVDVNRPWPRCPVCTRLYSPPVYQCNRGHLACGGCCASSGQCRRCGGSFRAGNKVLHKHNMADSEIKCPHSGCKGLIAFSGIRAHRGACPLAPCFCAVPGCTFAAPPHELRLHLGEAHKWPVNRVVYGKVFRLPAPLSQPRRLLRADDDGRLFVLLVRDLGPVTAVSVVCVTREDVETRYMAALRVEGSPPILSKPKAVTSSDRPGEVAAENLPFYFTVPPTHLVAGADGVSKEVPLKFIIQKKY